MTVEQTLLEKLKKIEALFLGAAFEGERGAAEEAIERIKERLKTIEQTDPPIEYKFTLSDMWTRKLLVALLRRYGIKPYRYYRQRYTTVMARIPVSFVENTLWPEYLQLSDTLKTHLEEVTDRLISESIHSDVSEAEIQPNTAALPDTRQ